MADSVGLALLVVLDTLTPAERVSFVLHDIFGLSFDEIAPIVGRSQTAARQLASRARRRVCGRAAVPDAELRRQRKVVDAFLAAVRAADFNSLLAVLDPDLVVHADAAAVPSGAPREIRGARTWAQGALAFSRFARFVQPAMVNGGVGLVLAPSGRLSRVLSLTITHGKIVHIDVIADPGRLSQLDVAVLDN